MSITLSLFIAACADFCIILWADGSSYLVVDGSGVGAVELVICSHDVREVRVPLTPQSLSGGALLMQVPGIT